MAVALTSPYCTSQEVAYFTAFMRGQAASDYDAASQPSKTVVDFVINTIASKIDNAYASVGYYIPFENKSGESWPSYQTEFLKYFNVVGVAMMMGGNVPSPPAIGPGRSRSKGSIFADEWSELIAQVKAIGDHQNFNMVTTALLRARVRPSTGADWRLSSVAGPTSDFLEGYYDPTRFDMLRDYTRRMRDFYKDMQYVAPESPDYMWIVHDRLGHTYAS